MRQSDAGTRVKTQRKEKEEGRGEKKIYTRYSVSPGHYDNFYIPRLLWRFFFFFSKLESSKSFLRVPTSLAE